MTWNVRGAIARIGISGQPLSFVNLRDISYK
jgi:hypothetical protein